MSGCLVPPLSVYLSPLVIYSSPIGIYSCRLLYAFIKGFFNALSIWLTTFCLYLNIWPHKFQKSLVYFSWIWFSKQFFLLCKWLIPCYTHSLFFSLGYMSKCSFQSFMAPCCSSTFNSNFWLYWPFHCHILDCFFPLSVSISIVSTYFFIIYSFSSTTIYWLFFQPHF